MDSRYLILVIFLTYSSLLYGQIKFRVIDDKMNPVKSVIIKINSKGEEKDLGPTDENGVFEDQFCSNSDKYQAKPFDVQYYHSRITYCNEIKGILSVSKIRYVNNLRHNFYFFEQKESSPALIIANELFYRYETINDDSSFFWKSKVYSIASDKLGVPNSFVIDTSRQDIIVTEDFMKAIQLFQKSNGLKITGELDYKTIRGLTEKKYYLSNFLFEQNKR